MTKYLYDRCQGKKWLQSFANDDNIPEVSGLGVAIRRPDSTYSVYPPAIDPSFISVLESLRLKVGLTMSSAFTEALLVHITPFQNEVLLSGRVKIPVVQSFESLLSGSERVQPESYACLVREERILMLWATSAEGILTHSADVEDRLMGLVSLPFDFEKLTTNHKQDLGIRYRHGRTYVSSSLFGSQFAHRSKPDERF